MYFWFGYFCKWVLVFSSIHRHLHYMYMANSSYLQYSTVFIGIHPQHYMANSSILQYSPVFIGIHPPTLHGMYSPVFIGIHPHSWIHITWSTLPLHVTATCTFNHYCSVHPHTLHTLHSFTTLSTTLHLLSPLLSIYTLQLHSPLLSIYTHTHHTTLTTLHSPSHPHITNLTGPQPQFEVPAQSYDDGLSSK